MEGQRAEQERARRWGKGCCRLCFFALTMTRDDRLMQAIPILTPPPAERSSRVARRILPDGRGVGRGFVCLLCPEELSGTMAVSDVCQVLVHSKQRASRRRPEGANRQVGVSGGRARQQAGCWPVTCSALLFELSIQPQLRISVIQPHKPRLVYRFGQLNTASQRWCRCVPEPVLTPCLRSLEAPALATPTRRCPVHLRKPLRAACGREQLAHTPCCSNPCWPPPVLLAPRADVPDY